MVHKKKLFILFCWLPLLPFYIQKIINGFSFRMSGMVLAGICCVKI